MKSKELLKSLVLTTQNIEFLERNGPHEQIKAKKQGLLNLAIKSGWTSIVNFLLRDQDININELNKEGFPPFILAIQSRNKEIINLLLADSKLDPKIRDSKNQDAYFYCQKKTHKFILSCKLGWRNFKNKLASKFSLFKKREIIPHLSNSLGLAEIIDAKLNSEDREALNESCFNSYNSNLFPWLKKHKTAVIIGPHLAKNYKKIKDFMIQNNQRELLYSEADDYDKIPNLLTEVKGAQPNKIIVNAHGDGEGIIMDDSPLTVLKATGAKHGSFYACGLGKPMHQKRKTTEKEREENNESIIQEIEPEMKQEYQGAENGTYIKINIGKSGLYSGISTHSVLRELTMDITNPIEDFISSALNCPETEKLIFKVKDKLHCLKISAPKFSKQEAENMTPVKLKEKIRRHLTNKILQFIDYAEKAGALEEQKMSKKTLLDSYFTKDENYQPSGYKINLTDEQIMFYGEYALLVEVHRIAADERKDKLNYDAQKKLHYVQSYLKGGIDANTPRLTKNGLPTPLGISCTDQSMVEFLLKQPGIDINCPGADGRRPIDIAFEIHRSKDDDFFRKAVKDKLRTANALLSDPRLILSKDDRDKLLSENKGTLLGSLKGNPYIADKKEPEKIKNLIEEAYQRSKNLNNTAIVHNGDVSNLNKTGNNNLYI